MSAFEVVAGLLSGERAEATYAEELSLAQHMLQAAAVAESSGADGSLQLASLLHDVGHLLDAPGRDELSNPTHASVGAEHLAAWFPAPVTEPVRLHVAAKRYLVAREPGYFDLLSPASVRTLELQGGPFTDEECVRFEAEPHADDALAVRRWDEAAKVPGRRVPGLDHYRSLVDEVAIR